MWWGMTFLVFDRICPSCYRFHPHPGRIEGFGPRKVRTRIAIRGSRYTTTMDTTGKASSISKHQISKHQATSKPQPTHPQGSLTSKKRRAVGAHPAARGKETRLGMVRRARRINRTLAVAYPNAHCELDFRNPYELAVATILSAQCTDCLLYTSPSPRDKRQSRMPSSA